MDSMSDADNRGESSSGDLMMSDDKDGNVCRDFLRNVCRRGMRCKYRHPDAKETEELGQKVAYVFCHDYQNKECRRPNCRFIHCSRSEEEYYRSTGDLPKHVLQDVISGKGLPNGDAISSSIYGSSGSLNSLSGGVTAAAAAALLGNKGEVPVCKDYLKGDCRRAARCKFRHLAPAEMTRRDPFDAYDRYDDYDRYEPEPKRRPPPGYMDDYGGGAMMTMGRALPLPPPPPPPIAQSSSMGYSHEYRIIEDENNLLRRKLEEMKKQVADLTATNEFLLDQNAQLRLSKSTTVSQVTTQSINPNTITATTTAVASAIAPISQQLPLNNELMAAAAAAAAAQSTLQAAATPGAVAAAVVQPPQTITPTAMVPVSLPQGTTMAAVSIAPVTISQSLPAVSLAQQALPQSIAITMSGPSTPLVSYPIVTQGMRPVLPQNSLAH